MYFSLFLFCRLFPLEYAFTFISLMQQGAKSAFKQNLLDFIFGKPVQGMETLINL